MNDTLRTEEDATLFIDAVEAAARVKCRSYCADETGETWWRHRPDVRDMHRADALGHIKAALAAGVDLLLEDAS